MKIFCIANGPSMKWQRFSHEEGRKYCPFAEGPDLHERMKREIVIGVNWIDLYFHPDYLIITDPEAYLGRGKDIICNSKAKLYVWDHQPTCKVPESAVKFSFYSTQEHILLSEYVDDGLMRNGSCIYSATNLAYIMGANLIYLIGVDFDIRENFLHMYDLEPQPKTFLESRAPADRGTLAYFETLSHHVDDFGIKIYNATEGGILQGFPKCTLQEALDMDDPVGDNILYRPDFSELRPEIRQMRELNEKSKLKLRKEVVDLWRQKQAP